MRRLPARLTAFAKRSNSERGWPALRRYSRERISKVDQGWALFVLGYREFEAGDYAPAATDLAGAAASSFPLAGLATYYEASAVYRGGDPARAVELLHRFIESYPNSPARQNAAELLAWAYLQTGKPQDVIRLLAEVPDVNETPKLALLLARAYQQADRPVDAASEYQIVFYDFPDTSESRAAKGPLDALKLQLGARFPQISDGIATARADKLFRQEDFGQALNEYDELLKERRGSPLAWQWNLSRGRCLLKQGKADQTIETLAGATPASAAQNAERLEILLEAYVQEKDEASENKVLQELESSYPTSPRLARALWVAADSYMWKPDLETAGRLYHRLAQAFPDTAEGGEASWEAAWTEYLAGKRQAAAGDFLALIRTYPSSFRVPGAIYFLGRIAQEQSETAKARELFDLIRRRFVHDYYAVEAARQLTMLEGRAIRRDTRGPAEAQTAQEIARLIPARDPIRIDPCDPALDDPSLDSYFALHWLGLDDLARETAEGFAPEQRRSPGFDLALGLLESETGRPDIAIQRVKQASPDYDWYEYEALPRLVWNLLFPRDDWRLVRTRAAAEHLDPYLVMALIRQESGFYPKAESSADARGLMQLLPDTASGSHSPWVTRRLSDPAFNIRLGCEYLRQMLKQYNGNLAEALAAYNAGPNRVDAWIAKYPAQTPEEFVETIPYPDTRVYVKAILRDQAMYRAMLTGSARYGTCRPAARPRAGREPSRRNRPASVRPES